MEKTVWILRGVSGAGKDFVTERLNTSIGWIVVSADNYFTDKEGNYNWDVTKLGNAHRACERSFMEGLKEQSVENIIVNNTNTKSSDWKFYETEAKKVGANVIFLVVENRHGNSNVHNVPNEVLDRHEQNIKNNLKLR